MYLINAGPTPVDDSLAIVRSTPGGDRIRRKCARALFTVVAILQPAGYVGEKPETFKRRPRTPSIDPAEI